MPYCTQKITATNILNLLTPQSTAMSDVIANISLPHLEEILRGATTPEEILFYLALTIKGRYTL